MTSRQRVQAAIGRRKPDRVPCCTSLTEVDKAWMRKTYGLADDDAAERFMGGDFRFVYPQYIGPELGISAKTGAKMTVWGITTKGGDYSVDGFPLAGADKRQIEEYPYPTPDLFDFKSFATPSPLAEEFSIKCGEPFSLLGKAYDLFGMEQVMIAMFEAPDLLHLLMEKITESRYAMIAKVLQTAPWVDIIYIMDELGTQNGLLLSPKLFREFVYPYHKRLTELVHSHNRLVFYHSCGAVMPLIGDLVEMGVDILDNIQPTAEGNDPYLVKKEFGKDLIIQAQVDEINVMAHGRPDEIYRKYRTMIEDLASDGGFFLSPTFRSQTTPRENLDALLRAIKEPL